MRTNQSSVELKSFYSNSPVAKKRKNSQIGIYPENVDLTIEAYPESEIEEKIDEYLITVSYKHVGSLPKGGFANQIYRKKDNYYPNVLVFPYEPTLALEIVSASTTNASELITNFQAIFAQKLKTRIVDIGGLHSASLLNVREQINSNDLQNFLTPKQMEDIVNGSVVVRGQTVYTVCKYIDALKKQYYKNSELTLTFTEEENSTREEDEQSHLPSMHSLFRNFLLPNGFSLPPPSTRSSESGKRSGFPLPPPSTRPFLPSPLIDQTLSHFSTPSDSKDIAEPGNTSELEDTSPEQELTTKPYSPSFFTIAKARKELEEMKRKRKFSEKRLEEAKRQKTDTINQLYSDIQVLRKTLSGAAELVTKVSRPSTLPKDRKALKHLAGQLTQEKNTLIKALKEGLKEILKETLEIEKEISSYKKNSSIETSLTSKETSMKNITSSDNLEILVQTYKKVLARYALAEKSHSEIIKEIRERTKQERKLYEKYKAELGSDDEDTVHNYSMKT